ncbi:MULTISPECIES: helix-turn-helix domain-containing protein [Actinobacillus]|uniref:Anaerobic benzoate catabolism transcriptional regulator n=1 Tax=Actinobacillus equuli TaxID=718 RepID=A0AAX3FLW0_ACTEU|nr:MULTISPECIES: helix-turn-helix transcriptional regulator [Actinobacillus]AIZ79731.1 transcriptional regulator [Actinobacillus equuli subsp. equuli]WGE43841.1 helix-turn-helix transcriptional regulator [Actinobacillus equuli subsp. equuli]SUT98471.1 anaerobic benzoate catabolism transcriptional regulator [Actinobacillus lignieresii]VEE90536.1 anaerobic benzoate catabolism transcriptional regulator [Actinobacillus equuli]
MLAKALKLIRQFNHIKQKDMAIKLGISPSHLSEIESGKNSISMELLNKYSSVFDIKTSQILLFSEQLENEKPFSHNVRTFIADKILKIMEWKIEQDKKKISKNSN